MRIRLRAIALAVLAIVLCPVSSKAEWKDTLIRSIAPTLVNRGINYLLRDKRTAVHKQPSNWTPLYEAPIDQAPYGPRVEKQTVAKPSSSPPRYLPPKPVITSDEMGHPASKTSGSKSASRSSSKNNLLAIPPPPNSMVPPPPPAVPTGAILGLYPEELMQLANEESPPPTETTIPRPAPDFRKAR